MRRKMLVIWDYDLGLTNVGFSISAFRAIKLYRKVAASNKRLLVLCMTTHTSVSDTISAMFDQIFFISKALRKCLKTNSGHVDTTHHPNIWWHSGWRNRLRHASMLALFASDHDRIEKRKTL